MSEPLRQLYDEQGRPIKGKGATKMEAFTGLLHGASHVWIWRQADNGPEVLVQKRSSKKAAWPGLYTTSAGGHIDMGEEPIEAAVRETHEEIGITVDANDLICIGTQRVYMEADNGIIENEFEWVYVMELNGEPKLTLQADEVASIEWKSLDDFQNETLADTHGYLPFGPLYYLTLISALEAVSTQA